MSEPIGTDDRKSCSFSNDLGHDSPGQEWSTAADAAVALRELVGMMRPGQRLPIGRATLAKLAELLSTDQIAPAYWVDHDRPALTGAGHFAYRSSICTPTTSADGIHDNPILRAIVADLRDASGSVIGPELERWYQDARWPSFKR